MNDQFKFQALVGSFRKASLNQALLATARELAPDAIAIGEVDLRQVPFYDGDVEAAGAPPEVNELMEAVRAADALLVITPEYNGSIPAVLKNAIDWASRGYPEAPISGKLAAVMGATPGRGGTAAAQQDLQKILARVGAVVVDAPTVAVASATDLVEDGRFVDEGVRADIDAVLSAVIDAVCLGRDCGSVSAVR